MKKPKELLDDLDDWSRNRYGRQRKVAAFLGVTPQQLNDWFAGRSMPTWETGHKIAEFFEKGDFARQKAIGEKPTLVLPRRIVSFARRNNGK